ncbi:MAG TPA: hypothetical protein VGK50_02245 [Coriobacteriia bacterium]|jgi:Tfp pilus assembly protein PilN
MIRINLLPPEITDKRKAEQRWKYLVFGAVAIYALLAVFWFVMFLRVTARTAEVSAAQQQAQALQTQANAFKIFEDRQTDLKARQVVAEKALAGRMEWSKLLNEIALVLPADAWLTTLHVDEAKFAAAGRSVDVVSDPTSSGFKPIAKLLVHMGDVQQLENVWLDNSIKGTFLDQDTVQFSVTADVAKPAAPASATAAVPAPPSKP